MKISIKYFALSTFLGLLALILAFYFINLLSQDVQFWDEATNLSAIAESSQSSDWWNLKFNGEFFWEKPPLFYWIGIVLFKFAGITNLHATPQMLTFLIRSLSFSSGLLIIFLLALFVHKHRSKQNFFQILLASCTVVLAIPNLWQFNPDQVTLATHNFISADSDALQLVCILLGYFFSEKISKKNALLTGLFSGVGFMLKGPFGLLPIAISVIEQSFKSIKSKHITKKTIQFVLIQIITASLIILPWYMFMSLQFGGKFLEENIIYHQFQRASSALEGHQKGLLFYIEFLLNPATSGILLLSFISLVIRKFQITKELVTGVVILTLLSLMGTKLSWYSLYTYPFFLIYIISSVRYFTFSRFSLKHHPWFFMSFLFVGIILVQLVLTTISITQSNAPVWLSSSQPSDQIAYSLYLSDRSPHRVFYYESLIDQKNIFSTSEIRSLDVQSDTEIIFDRHEFEEEEMTESNLDENYQIKITHLSHNYAKLLIYET